MKRLEKKPDASATAAAGRRGAFRSGVVLLVTMVLLVVLATLTYTVTSRVAAHRHRIQYLIDYAKARYGRDSALKYALTAAEGLDLSLVSRPNEPDFSDLFAMNDEQVDGLLAKAGAADKDHNRRSASLSDKEKTALKRLLGSAAGGTDTYLAKDNNGQDANNSDPWAGLEEEEKVVRGPYGPPWPLVAEPIEFEIDSVRIRVEIEDENAKYPLGWMLMDDPAVQRAANAGFETFCEWMNWTTGEIDSLKEQLAQVAGIKTFRFLSDTTAAAAAAVASRGSPAAPASAATRQPVPRVGLRRFDTTPVSPTEQQSTDLGRLVHSSLLDHELLSRPTVTSNRRKESLAKYIGLWGTAQVNINTAPRHVLEAAFAFVGDAAPIAEAIIRQRKIQPLKDVGDLRKMVTRYADSIEKCSRYITTGSTCFTIRITAHSGAARSCIVAGVIKEGKAVRAIGIISG